MHKVMRSLALFAALGAVGCGDSPSQMADMAIPPDMAMTPPPPLYLQDSTGAQKPADYSCLGTRTDPAAPTADYVLTGKVADFQDNDPVAGAVVSVYLDAQSVAMNQPAAQSMPSAMDGTYTLTVPKGQYRVIFGTRGGKAISSGGTAKDTIDTFEFGRAYKDAGRTAVKVTTRDAIPGLVSVVPDVTLGVIAGSVRDCAGKEVGGAKVAITGTSAMYDAASLTFYFTDVGGATLPTRKLKWTDGANGVFAALNVPPGSATVTAIGIVGSGDLKTLGAQSINVPSGAVTIVEVLPTAAK